MHPVNAGCFLYIRFMTRGPNPKPAALAKEDGTYRDDRHRDDLAGFFGDEIDIPKPPEILGEIGVREWNRVWTIVEVNNIQNYILPPDHTLLEQYCMNYQIMCLAAEDVKKNGVQIVTYKRDKQGNKIKDQDGDYIVLSSRVNPAFRTYNNCSDKHIKYSSMFGFSPSDRTRINLQVHISKKINAGFDKIPQGKPPDDFQEAEVIKNEQ